MVFSRSGNDRCSRRMHALAFKGWLGWNLRAGVPVWYHCVVFVGAKGPSRGPGREV